MPYCFLRSSIEFQGHTGQKIVNFDPFGAFPDCNFSFKFTDGFEKMHKAWCSMEDVPCHFSTSSIKFQGHTGWKTQWFGSNLSKITRPVAAIKSLRFVLFNLNSKLLMCIRPVIQCVYTLSKMATILQMEFSNWFSSMEMDVVRFKFSLVPKGRIDNKPSLAQIMDWRRWRDRLLSEPTTA